MYNHQKRVIRYCKSVDEWLDDTREKARVGGQTFGNQTSMSKKRGSAEYEYMLRIAGAR